jgi:hypothetical protein
MLNSGAQSDAPTHRVAHNVGPLQPKIFDQRRDVIGHSFIAQGTRNVGGMSMALQIDSYHLPIIR